MSFALLAILTAVGTLTISTAYAAEDLPQACVGCSMEDARVTANEMLLRDIPISVWADKKEYNRGDMIMVKGQVANTSGFPVTVTVVSPTNVIAAIDQLVVAKDGSFMTTINTTGPMWKYDGTYTIKVNYGNSEKSNRVKVEMTGGVVTGPTPSKQCKMNELAIIGNCVPYSITGGVVTGATVNTNENSIVISINAKEDGQLTITPSKTVLDGIFMVLVDGEESNDEEIVGNKVTVMFPAGTEKIEIIGTYVIPEFGAIAAMILAVAIITTIAISARSRLSIIPRY